MDALKRFFLFFVAYIYIYISLSPLRFSTAHMQFTLRPKSASVLSVSNGKHLSTAATHVSERSATHAHLIPHEWVATDRALSLHMYRELTRLLLSDDC